MSTALHRSLETLFRELIDGPDASAAWMLNGGDAGLLRSVDELTATAASVAPATGGATIAAHLDHVRYGVSLMNRWGRGEPVSRIISAPFVRSTARSADRLRDRRPAGPVHGST